MNIKLAERSDLPAILAVANWAAEHTVANFAIKPESLDMWQKSWDETHEMHPWLIAEVDGVVAGFAKSSPYRGRCAYNWTAEVTVYILPKFHGQRLGTRLYAELFEILKVQGYVSLLAGITLPNPASVKLHENFGFTHTCTFHHVGWKFNQWHDVGFWELIFSNDSKPPGNIRPVKEVCGLPLASQSANK